MGSLLVIMKGNNEEPSLTRALRNITYYRGGGGLQNDSFCLAELMLFICYLEVKTQNGNY